MQSSNLLFSSVPKTVACGGFDDGHSRQKLSPMGLYHGERAGVKLHVSYSPEQSLLMGIVETIGLRHDGPVGEPLTNIQQVLVEDRAYFKIERIDRFVE